MELWETGGSFVTIPPVGTAACVDAVIVWSRQLRLWRASSSSTASLLVSYWIILILLLQFNVCLNRGPFIHDTLLPSTPSIYLSEENFSLSPLHPKWLWSLTSLFSPFLFPCLHHSGQDDGLALGLSDTDCCWYPKCQLLSEHIFFPIPILLLLPTFIVVQDPTSI